MGREMRDGMGVLGSLLLLLVFVVGATLTAMVAAGLSSLVHGVPVADALEGVRSDPLLGALAQVGGAVAAVYAHSLSRGSEDVPLRAALSVRPTSMAVVGLAVLAGLGLSFPLHEVANLFGDLFPELATDRAELLFQQIRIDSLRDAVVVPLAFVAIPAVSEELFFRGLLLPGLARRIHPRAALVVSSIYFGLVHIDPSAIVYATLAGLVLGHVRMRTGSVLPSIALHGAANALPILLPAEILPIRGFNTFEHTVHHLPLMLVLGSFAVTLVCLVGIGRITDEEV